MLVNRVIIASDPIETISTVALDSSYGQNKTMYLSAESLESLPMEFLQELDNAVVGFRGDKDGNELADEFLEVLPKSKRLTIGETGWNGILQEQLRQTAVEQTEVEQMQLVTQYQSQQESEMETITIGRKLTF